MAGEDAVDEVVFEADCQLDDLLEGFGSTSGAEIC